jgi:Cdc6-like AAA superfamily ATPase
MIQDITLQNPTSRDWRLGIRPLMEAVPNTEDNPIVESGALYQRTMSFDSPPFTERDLSGVDTQLIRVPTQEKFIGQMVNAMKYFFSRGDESFSDHFSSMGKSDNFPFKGFVLTGPPGSGKTEAVIEAGRRLYSELAMESIEVRLLHISTADINRGRVGEMEQRLRSVFNEAKSEIRTGLRTILLFDDIDTLLMSRDDKRSEEWSVSLNATFFHAVDRLRTSDTMICATTNKTEMLDDAVKSRLSVKEAPAPNFEEMKIVAKSALPLRGANGLTQDQLLELAAERILENQEAGEPDSFRLA